MLGPLTRVVDAGEVLDLAGARRLVEALGVALLAQLRAGKAAGKAGGGGGVRGGGGGGVCGGGGGGGGSGARGGWGVGVCVGGGGAYQRIVRARAASCSRAYCGGHRERAAAIDRPDADTTRQHNQPLQPTRVSAHHFQPAVATHHPAAQHPPRWGCACSTPGSRRPPCGRARSRCNAEGFVGGAGLRVGAPPPHRSLRQRQAAGEGDAPCKAPPPRDDTLVRLQGPPTHPPTPPTGPCGRAR